MNITCSSNPVHGEVYSIQHYVIKLVSDLQQVYGLLRFPPPIKLTHDITEILLKVALNSITKPNHYVYKLEKPRFLYNACNVNIVY